MHTIKTVCVYCSSSGTVAAPYFAAAETMGELLARRGYTLIYGGATVGLMGALAKAVHRHGGRVIGVIPRFMRDLEIAYEAADECIVTSTMRERKEVMETRADAFIALPGGFGTLEEVLEVLTLRQLGRHHKPIVFLDTEGFYQPLELLFERFYEHRFAKPASRGIYHVAREPEGVMRYLQDFRAEAPASKWT